MGRLEEKVVEVLQLPTIHDWKVIKTVGQDDLPLIVDLEPVDEYGEEEEGLGEEFDVDEEEYGEEEEGLGEEFDEEEVVGEEEEEGLGEEFDEEEYGDESGKDD